MSGALEGLKVRDFSTLLPGPMAGLFLADAGAEVIKIERPQGEEMRHYLPRWGADAVNFAMLNRGKKSLALDLKDPAARALLDPLLREADVVIEQFRPGVMARLGLGYADVQKLNPDIVYCSIIGYGQTGPKAQRAGHDLNYIGDAGLLALSHGTPQTPVLPPALIADIAGGTYPALLNILLALRARDAGKGGAHLDIAMAETLFPFMYWAMGDG
ncbi:CoA-transferase family III [Tropicibacter naphthalenivorans]|uniref:Formyl-coenzyme A transferase n=1 Tax=Tropicibacter naphthalenivorans TaxID=441103 RepID=A0A0P1GHG1_9RHOB|nr:Formyl-coenzyme A transferase [Tropicibacter naphthalenivorans]SMC98283.1 CoA-transferase family III [Tropicibacter naphthalenivorans]